MNAPEKLPLPDIQSQLDTRNICIDAVGVKGVRYPVTIASAGRTSSTVATFTMTVGLAATTKGTHMSRFIELLESRSAALGQRQFVAMALDMLDRLEAREGVIEMRFPYFVRKAAPASGVESMLDLDVCWKVKVSQEQRPEFSMQVVVAATSLCPCSKEISAYGAHNQRSHITIDAVVGDNIGIEDLISIAERNASSEVYGLLKRVDEKYVTERAYDNPKFVEDLVRDVALSLAGDPGIGAYIVEAENFESIHNHSAFARVTGLGRAAGR